MKHLYLFVLEVTPLEVGVVYDDLPSHLTSMSRFFSNLAPDELSSVVRPLFANIQPVSLIFGSTIKLGPKKVTAHMVSSAEEQSLHMRLQVLLEKAGVIFQYPEFIGVNHKAHITQRDGVDFPPKTHLLSLAAYLVEVIDGRRIIRSRFSLGKPEQWYNVAMTQITKAPSKKVQNWTKDFIKKYKPALKELSKK